MNTYCVSCILNQGVGIKTTVDSFRLTKNDVLVLYSGYNDVYNDNTRKAIFRLIMIMQHNNVRYIA